MPTAASLLAASERHRNAINSVFGMPVKIDNVEGTGAYTAPHWEDKLVDGGFERKFTTKLRIRKADWPAYAVPTDFLKKPVAIKVGNAWQNFGILEKGVTDVHLTGEWIIELEGLT